MFFLNQKGKKEKKEKKHGQNAYTRNALCGLRRGSWGSWGVPGGDRSLGAPGLLRPPCWSLWLRRDGGQAPIQAARWATKGLSGSGLASLGPHPQTCVTCGWLSSPEDTKLMWL